MKKKLFAVCLMTVMSFALATGCSSKETQPTPQPEQAQKESEDEQKPEDEKTAELNYDKIVVGMDDTFAPMGFRDENGELTGLDVELAQFTSQMMGIPFELQPIDWSMKETELANGNIDLIWNGYSITEERKEKVLFSNPYLANKMVVVTMADSEIQTLEDLNGKVVAVQAESSALDAIDSKPEIRDTFQELATLETNNDCLMDLEAGRSDAVVGDEVLIRYYIAQKGPEKYKVLEENFGEEQYAVGARKEDTALIEAINNAFDDMKESGKAGEISTKWFGSDIIQ